ncbi:SDR family NAD(P)-dependent oxidoreductase, partial [Paenibacillus alba]|uniref:SDR family NAD(P)-dependent oxidoreductase n=1 Tax=Paenibacillus alba TaxID=1197127 RepID=UPI0015676709
AKLKQLEVRGARVAYRQVDVSCKEAVEELVVWIQEEFGGLNGIIHSAGVIRDNYILRKTTEEWKEVLNPKVAGVRNLDEATKGEKLDFVILFSSGAGVIGNPGQADYATANGFMDVYAGYRNKLAAAGQRSGHTLSINWPLWKQGGMQVDEEIEAMMRQDTGAVALETPQGIEAFYRGFASGQDQVMVVAG